MKNTAIIELIRTAQSLIDVLPETHDLDINYAVANLQDAIRFADVFTVPIDYESVFRVKTVFHAVNTSVFDAVKIYDKYGVAVVHDADAVTIDEMNSF